MQYHWLITVQARDGRQATYSGVVEISPGSSRNMAYEVLINRVADQLGTTVGGLGVLFFTLEPDQM